MATEEATNKVTQFIQSLSEDQREICANARKMNDIAADAINRCLLREGHTPNLSEAERSKILADDIDLTQKPYRRGRSKVGFIKPSEKDF